MRVVAMIGGPTRNDSVMFSIAFSGVGGGGAIPVEPRYVDDSPIARLR